MRSRPRPPSQVAAAPSRGRLPSRRWPGQPGGRALAPTRARAACAGHRARQSARRRAGSRRGRSASRHTPRQHASAAAIMRAAAMRGLLDGAPCRPPAACPPSRIADRAVVDSRVAGEMTDASIEHDGAGARRRPHGCTPFAREPRCLVAAPCRRALRACLTQRCCSFGGRRHGGARGAGARAAWALSVSSSMRILPRAAARLRPPPLHAHGQRQVGGLSGARLSASPGTLTVVVQPLVELINEQVDRCHNDLLLLRREYARGRGPRAPRAR